MGGNLVQAVAQWYPYNYAAGYTFNAFGINYVPNQTKKVTNFKISTDPVSAVHKHLGKEVTHKIRAYPNQLTGLASHELFNFYGYFFPAKTKYWNSGYGVPYATGGNNFGW